MGCEALLRVTIWFSTSSDCDILFSNPEYLFLGRDCVSVFIQEVLPGMPKPERSPILTMGLRRTFHPSAHLIASLPMLPV